MKIPFLTISSFLIFCFPVTSLAYYETLPTGYEGEESGEIEAFTQNQSSEFLTPEIQNTDEKSNRRNEFSTMVELLPGEVLEESAVDTDESLGPLAHGQLNCRRCRGPRCRHYCYPYTAVSPFVPRLGVNAVGICRVNLSFYCPTFVLIPGLTCTCYDLYGFSYFGFTDIVSQVYFNPFVF